MESHESIKNAAIQLKVFNETTNILIFIGAGRTRTHPKKKNYIKIKREEREMFKKCATQKINILESFFFWNIA